MSGNAIVVRRCSLGTALPEQQQQPLQPPMDDTQKTTPGNMAFHRAEVIRRNSLAGHTLGPWGHVKNIPIANVAPFVHSRVDDEKSKLAKTEEQFLAQQQGATGSNQSPSRQSPDMPPDVKEEDPRMKPEDLDKISPALRAKDPHEILATSSKKE
ncbi:unnamed protein product, partial [Lymnaea stagnalis]